MANWVELSDVKSYLWITDNNSDDKLNLLIPAVQETLINVIGDISESSKTDQISFCDIDNNSWSFIVNNSNVTLIESIDWTSYVWTLNIDYIIRYWRKLYINNLTDFIDTNRSFNFFDITYKSGFAVIPSDIKLLMYIMISWEMSREGGQSVSSYSLWDVSVSYNKEEGSPLIFNSILWKYKIINI